MSRLESGVDHAPSEAGVSERALAKQAFFMEQTPALVGGLSRPRG